MAGPEPAVPSTASPTQTDPLARALSPVIGGPYGSRSSGHWWWTPLRVLLALTAVTFALGMVAKSGCYTSSWQDEDVRYQQMCYSDLPYLYGGRGFAELHWPYSEPEAGTDVQAMEYPVGISYWAWGTAWVTQKLMGVDADTDLGSRDLVSEARAYVVVNALGFAFLTLLSTWFLVSAAGRRPWDALAYAVAPVLAATALINWDFPAVVLVAATLWAWVRDRPALTGVLIGVGTAVKLFPLFLLGAVLVLCLRRRQLGVFLTTVLWAAISWTVLNVPAMLGGWDRWLVFWTFNSERAADLGSAWLAIQQLTGHVWSAETINQWSWILFGLWCVAVLVLGLKAPVAPRFAQLGFLIVVGFLLVNKVYSPQYVLWLLPLAVLARPRLRDQLIWQAGELIYFGAVWWYLSGDLSPGSGDSTPAYVLAIGARMAAQLWLVAMVVRDMFRPEHDPVREREREPTPVPEPVDGQLR